MSNQPAPSAQVHRNLLLEGIDRSGKSTIAQLFAAVGYHVIHAAYNPYYVDMHLYYRDLILQAPEPVVFDRSFLAELVYGPVLRGTSRLSLSDMQSLLECLAKKSVVVLYLSESQEVLTQRLIETRDAHPQVLEHLDELFLAYKRCLQIVARYVPTYTLCPTTLPKEQLFDHVVELMNKQS